MVHRIRLRSPWLFTLYQGTPIGPLDRDLTVDDQEILQVLQGSDPFEILGKVELSSFKKIAVPHTILNNDEFANSPVSDRNAASDIEKSRGLSWLIYRRRFGKPTGLDSATEVFLSITNQPLGFWVVVNNHILKPEVVGRDEHEASHSIPLQHRCHLEQELASDNYVSILIPAPRGQWEQGQESGLVGEVELILDAGEE